MQIFIFFIILAVLFVVAIRYLEYKSIFYPTRRIGATPASIGLPFEDVFIKTKDNLTINAWLIKSSTARGTLIFCHGNAGNIGDRLEKILLFHQLGLHVLIIDYRGYGKSQGRPSEMGVCQDAVAAYDYLCARQDIDHSRIIGYGASLGGAVIINLAIQRKLAAIIVHSSFTSVEDMAKRIYPFIPTFLLKTKLESVRLIPSLTIPKLFIHSQQDEIVPFQLGQKLYQSACPPKEFFEVLGGHNNMPADSQEKMAKEIIAFLYRYNVIDFPKSKSDE